jgi:predicted ATP-binding protein involved in virulence
VVSGLVPEFSNLRIQEQPRLGFVVDKRGQPFYLHQLSDGERGLLALVFDLTRRLAIANPDSDDPIAEGVALVLIDEIELHLHPKWQRDVIKRLPSIFKSCQFVITTHSPQVIGEVEARCVRLLSWRNDKVVVDTPAMAYGTDSNWILSVLMGADEMNEDVESKLENASRMISERNLDGAKELIHTLRSDVKGNTDAIQRLASMIERIERLGK